ncbi:MAG: ComF family protein [Geobacteraceae bacterium]|nr:ComF family protein [Geobacteraceae bacterium]
MFFKAFLDILFPPRCHVCRCFLAEPTDIHLCDGCREKILTVRSPLCTICGVPFATENGIDHTCGHCLTTQRPFAGARAAARFEGPLQELIHRFKYGRKIHLSRPLGLLTATALGNFHPATSADCIIPVPLHRRRLRERGFNQSQLIGQILAKSWEIPLSVHNLRRIHWTKPQTGLSAAERERNIRNAFEVALPDRVKGKRLLLVDDVYTTGSTVTECAKTLRQSGAKEIHVITVARAVM